MALIGALIPLTPCVPARAWTLPATGIAACYNDTTPIPCPQPGQDFYGQDGNYRKGAALAYQSNGDGTVTDATNALVWERSASAAA